MSEKPYIEFSEWASKHRNFYPEFSCSHCGHVFSGNYTSSKNRGGGLWALCSQCSNILLISFEGGQIFNMHCLDLERFSWDEIARIILANVKPCECGGRFEVNYRAKCPKCFQELGDFVIAYPAINKWEEKAFYLPQNYSSYQEKVVELGRENKLYYHYGAEVAFELYDAKKLRAFSQEEIQEIKKTSLPLFTKKMFLAEKWLIEKPKRSLFELYTHQLFEIPRYQKLPMVNVTMCQYQAAYNIAYLAGQPFSKMPPNFLHPDIEKKRKEFSDEVAKQFGQLSDIGALFKDGDYAEISRIDKEVGLSEKWKEFEDWFALNKNEIEIPWIQKAQKEIQRWQAWWHINKDLLPV